jgi:hypothetical protein
MRQLDQRADLEFECDGRFHVIIVGGGALVLRNYLARSTDDIDLLEVDKRLHSLLRLYDMNSNTNAHIFSFPYNYEDRAEIVWSGKKIDYFTASLEDLVISKIGRYQDKDMIDFAQLINKINWELLDKLATDDNELQLISMSDRNLLDFKACYEDFLRRYRPCKD